jgi:cell division protein FtsI/penicillin-binding protein 2
MANKEVESVGIESAFDSHLRGTTGKRLMQRIAGGCVEAGEYRE